MQQGQIHQLLQLQMQQFQAMTHFVMGSSSRPINVQIDPRSNRSLPAWALDTSMALEPAGDRRDQRSIAHHRQSRSPLRRSVHPTHSPLRRHRDGSGHQDRSRRRERSRPKQHKSKRTVETSHNTPQKDRVASVPKQTQFPPNKLDPSKSRQPVLSLSLNAQDLEPRPKSDASSLMGRHTMEWFGQTLWYEVNPPLLQSDLQLGMTITIGRANLSCMYDPQTRRIRLHTGSYSSCQCHCSQIWGTKDSKAGGSVWVSSGKTESPSRRKWWRAR